MCLQYIYSDFSCDFTDAAPWDVLTPAFDVVCGCEGVHILQQQNISEKRVVGRLAGQRSSRREGGQGEPKSGVTSQSSQNYFLYYKGGSSLCFLVAFVYRRKKSPPRWCLTVVGGAKEGGKGVRRPVSSRLGRLDAYLFWDERHHGFITEGLTIVLTAHIGHSRSETVHHGCLYPSLSLSRSGAAHHGCCHTSE